MPPPPRAALADLAAVVSGGGRGGAEPTRHLLDLPLWCPQGGLPSLSPAYPAFHFAFAPYPPNPLPRRGRGRLFSLFRRGLRPRHPCIRPFAALTELAAVVPAGGGGETEPTRHLFSLPRGRGPSQTPPSLATDSSSPPVPPSPWLPALPIEGGSVGFAPSWRFRRHTPAGCVVRPLPQCRAGSAPGMQGAEPLA